MKKLIALSLTALLLAAATTSAEAQVPKSPVSFYAGGLISLPQSEGFSDLYGNGFHFFGGVGLKMLPVELVGKIEFNSFAAEDGGFGLDITGGDNSLLLFGVDAKKAFGAPAVPLKPYVLGGLGIAMISVGDFETNNPLATSTVDLLNQTEDVSEFYYEFGAGVELATTPLFSFFAQARWVSIQTDGEATNYIPISLGIKFF